MSMVLAVSAATGFVMGMEPLLSGARLTSTHPSGRPPVGTENIDEAFARARTLFPDDPVHDFRRPTPDQFYVLFKAPDVGARAVHFVRFDLDTGELRERRFARDIATLANEFYPFHTGEEFGAAGRVVVLTSGILLAGLAFSGLVMWKQSPSPKKAVRHPAKAGRKADPGKPLRV